MRPEAVLLTCSCRQASSMQMHALPTCHLCQRSIDELLRAGHSAKADAPHALVICKQA
jgi:hypothetical protein